MFYENFLAGPKNYLTIIRRGHPYPTVPSRCGRKYLGNSSRNTLSRETPLECAQSKLTEETGFKSTSIKKLGYIVPESALSNERITLFFATGLTPAEHSLEMNEQLDVREVQWVHVLLIMDKGEVKEAKTVAGIHMAQKHSGSSDITKKSITTLR